VLAKRAAPPWISRPLQDFNLDLNHLLPGQSQQGIYPFQVVGWKVGYNPGNACEYQLRPGSWGHCEKYRTIKSSNEGNNSTLEVLTLEFIPCTGQKRKGNWATASAPGRPEASTPSPLSSPYRQFIPSLNCYGWASLAVGWQRAVTRLKL